MIKRNEETTRFREWLMGGNPMDVDGKTEAARFGIGASSALAYTLTLNQWIGIFTIIYLVMHIIVILPKVGSTFRYYWNRFRGR